MQSKKLSLTEALTSTAVGLVYAYSLNLLIAKAYGFPMTSTYSAILTFWMTVASVVRTYIMRRIFEWFPRWWKQFWCQHRYDFVETVGEEVVQQCSKCDHCVIDKYVA